MKMVVLDGFTLNPGDLTWNELKGRGDLTVYDRTAPAEVVSRARDAEVLFTNKVALSKEMIDDLPKLKYIGVIATGYNIVDVDHARMRGVIVSNAPGYGTASVVQLAFSLLLEHTHHVQRHSDAVMAGKWARSKDFCFWDFPLVELAGKTMGIIGFGTIGQSMADAAAGFGMKIIAYSRTKTDQSRRANFQWVELPELFRRSDVISIHCPLTPETKGLVNRENLALMKSSAFLINTSRGPIVNDADLAAALNDGVIAGAGIDVMSSEPPEESNPLFGARNCFITPHIAWATRDARERLMSIVVANLDGFLSGSPQNVVN